MMLFGFCTCENYAILLGLFGRVVTYLTSDFSRFRGVGIGRKWLTRRRFPAHELTHPRNELEKCHHGVITRV